MNVRSLVLWTLVVTILGGTMSHVAEGKIIERRGGKVSVVKFNDGTWELQVGGKPYFIKGVLYDFTKIGEGPGEGTKRDWMLNDDNHNGRNDAAYDSYLFGDPAKKPVGDFQFLKELGANTIRLYHVASDNPILGDIYKLKAGDNGNIPRQFKHPLNKALLRDLYQTYGVRVIMGNFLGSWTVGSGTSWNEGADYTNPKHRDAVKRSMKATVLDSKDEPYVLFWLLGNENNIATWSRCNASQQPKAYASLIGEIVEMIHELDPDHPVAVCEGDSIGFNTLRLYPTLAPAVDIVGFNVYRGKNGAGFLWRDAGAIFDRPIFISEYGVGAYRTGVGEDQDLQRDYDAGNWKDIVLQSRSNVDSAKHRTGRSIGGTVYQFVEEWWSNGEPHKHNPGTKYWPVTPDHLGHIEWCGLMAMDTDSQSDPLLRRPRKSYSYFKEVWNRETPSY